MNTTEQPTPSAKAEPQFDLGRVTVPESVRSRAATMRSLATRLDKTLGAMWSTQTSMSTARDELLEIARLALAQHQEISQRAVD